MKHINLYLLFYKSHCENVRRPPPVSAFSFSQSLPDLHDKHCGFLLWDVDMLCYLIRFAMPLTRFLFVSTGFCSPASFSVWIAPSHLAACYGFRSLLLPQGDFHPMEKYLHTNS